MKSKVTGIAMTMDQKLEIVNADIEGNLVVFTQLGRQYEFLNFVESKKIVSDVGERSSSSTKLSTGIVHSLLMILIKFCVTF